VIKEKLESELGEITDEELVFAIDQFERNNAIVGKKIFDDTAYDILSTNIDFFRRHNLAAGGH
jgi:hypothetical protein